MCNYNKRTRITGHKIHRLHLISYPDSICKVTYIYVLTMLLESTDVTTTQL